MEQHPVPQNVTGFQFKLIGDITLKQFAYLAGGIIVAYITFKVSLIPVLLRYPTAIFSVLLGFGLAFVPIEERPLDRWLIAFFKSIYSPTQYVWKKHNSPPELLVQLAENPAMEVGKKITPTPASPIPTSNQVPQPSASVIPISTLPINQPPPPPPPLIINQPAVKPLPPVNMPTASTILNKWAQGAPVVKSKPLQPQTGFSPSITGKRVVYEEKAPVPPTSKPDPKQVEKIKSQYEKNAQKLTDQINSLQGELQKGTIAKERFLELQQVLMELVSEKERLSKELALVKRQLNVNPQAVIERPTEYVQPPPTKSSVKIVPPQSLIHVGIPKLTSQPNVITGIIKDSQGNLLPNLIVMVKDKEGIPMRALKTNKLGQFAASTPLTTGVYIIEIEDPKKNFQFNQIEINLANEVLSPLEISAISQRDVLRQKLTQEIFGGNKL